MFAFTLCYVMLREVRLSCFLSMFHARNLLYIMSLQKQVAGPSLILMDSDTKSESLSSLIHLSVSDGQKTDSSKIVSCIGI